MTILLDFVSVAPSVNRLNVDVAFFLLLSFLFFGVITTAIANRKYFFDCKLKKPSESGCNLQCVKVVKCEVEKPPVVLYMGTSAFDIYSQLYVLVILVQ